MAITTTIDRATLSDKNVQKLVDQMIELTKLQMVQGFNARANKAVYKYQPKTLLVGGRERLPVKELAQVAAELFDRLSPDKVQVLKNGLGADRDISALILSKGIDMRSDRSIREQIDTAKHFSFVNDKNFSADRAVRVANSLTNAVLFDRLPLGPVVGNIVLNRGLKCRVHEVKCVDETDPEWPGSDTIAWGGATVSASGVTERINEMRVGDDFDDGDRKTYNPPLILKSFNINGASYPLECSVILSLAEKDNGGLSDFITDLYNAVKGEIQVVMTALGAAAGAAIGVAIGGATGTAVGGPIGTIIGVAAGAIVGALVGWLTSVLKDDIFEPQMTSAYLERANSTFAGGALVSPRATLNYRGHGGFYQVVYDWEIVR